MAKFIFHHRSRTLASIATRDQQQKGILPRIHFEFPEFRAAVIIRDHVEQLEGVTIHGGLNLIIEIDAPSETEAADSAKAVIENLLILITYSTLAFAGSAELISAIGMQEPVSFTSQVRPFDQPDFMASATHLVEQELRELWEAMNTTNEPARIVRALAWLRKGINEENFVDEFIAYWVGLEVIKSILRRMLKMKIKDPGEWHGVRVIYENTLHLTDFDQMEDVRNRLLHGYQELSTAFIAEIRTLVQPARTTLIASVAHALGLTDPLASTLLKKNIRRSRKKPWIKLSGILNGLPNKLELIADTPPTILPNPQTQLSINESGQLEASVELKMTFHGPPGVSFDVTQQEHWADEDSGISKIQTRSIEKVGSAENHSSSRPL